jgi:hypothetical protein
MTSLDEQQKTKIKESLRSLGNREEGFECSACHMGKLMEPSVIITLPDTEDMKVVPLTCNTCARVTFLNAEMLGL